MSLAEGGQSNLKVETQHVALILKFKWKFESIHLPCRRVFPPATKRLEVAASRGHAHVRLATATVAAPLSSAELR